MSDQWHGGKGSKDRVKDYQKYWNSPLWKNKHESPKYNLFLDDYRNPKDAFLYDDTKTLRTASNIMDHDWVVVRNYDQFVAYIEDNGLPEVISFDNDLCDHHMRFFQESLMIHGQYYDYNKVEKTGIHCALWLKEKCNKELKPVPKYFVHSANHLARPIIREILG